MGGAIPESAKPEVLKFAVIFEHRCKEGAKAIIHLEAFLARVMCLYKGAMSDMNESEIREVKVK
jgi:replication factor C subunit 3/5